MCHCDSDCYGPGCNPNYIHVIEKNYVIDISTDIHRYYIYYVYFKVTSHHYSEIIPPACDIIYVSLFRRVLYWYTV